MRVDIRTTSHNSLRWVIQAIDSNAQFANSLVQHGADGPVMLTDSIYLLTHGDAAAQLPMHAHIVFWDGLNSYVELLARQPALALRTDLRFYVVGWLRGVALDPGVQIEPLYAPAMTEKAKAWKRMGGLGPAYYAPYWYRAHTSLLTHARYFKNRMADRHKHQTLVRGGKIVFCGLVTPTAPNVDAFFMGVELPALRQACQGLTTLTYTSGAQAIDSVVGPILAAIRSAGVAEASELACVYSILNVLHRIKTLSLLQAMDADLFVNETRNTLRFDPYDCFRYRKNLYLDFGSTRGPDAIYPRTLDLHMTGKRFVSVRLLGERQTIRDYLDTLTLQAFSAACQAHAQAAADLHAERYTT
jgi:hypothetical protein